MHSDTEEYKEREWSESSGIDGDRATDEWKRRKGKDGRKKSESISLCIWHSSRCPVCVLSSYSTVQPGYSKASHIAFCIELQHFLPLPPTSSYSPHLSRLLTPYCHLGSSA